MQLNEIKVMNKQWQSGMNVRSLGRCPGLQNEAESGSRKDH